MLIKMIDGGLVNYNDNTYFSSGCPTCDYGSEYVNEIDITLTHYSIHIKTNQMYEYVLSEGDMMKLFLSEYNTIQTMTEKEFVDWLKEQIYKIVYGDEFNKALCDRIVREFEVTEV